MPRLIVPRDELQRIIRQRRACGGDRHDEVWNGVYVMSPLADNEHQRLMIGLATVMVQAMAEQPGVQIFGGVNVSDRPERWKKNFRCPDVAVFLPGNPAEDRGTHWLGGPDFAIEILSPRDRARKKLAFYARVGVRELLLVDRDPWTLELYRLEAGGYTRVGVSDLANSQELLSTVLSLALRLRPGPDRPRIEVTRPADGATWQA